MTHEISHQQLARLKTFEDVAIFDWLLTGPELALIASRNPLPPDLAEPIIPGVGIFMIHGQLCLLKKPCLLSPLMLRPAADTLLGDDLRAVLASVDPSRYGAVARYVAP